MKTQQLQGGTMEHDECFIQQLNRLFIPVGHKQLVLSNLAIT
jgi:hypothetical protein